MKLARFSRAGDATVVNLRRSICLAIVACGLLVAVDSTPAQSSQKGTGETKRQETEADRVVQDTELQTRLAQEREELISEHFLVCDLDENGWISFREASTIFGITRKEFRRCDTDKDGDIDASEFRERARTLLSLLGALPPPRPRGDTEKSSVGPSRNSNRPARITVEQLLERFDVDVSGSLTFDELRKLFDLTEADLSPELISERMDPNGSGALEANELRPVATLLSEMRVVLPPPSALADNPDPTTPSFEKLYNRDREAERPTTVTGGPPRIEGPVSHFRRLDLWNDGYIDEADLRQLIAPARVEVRVAAILSALDTDGDNRLSEEEFRTALKGK